MMYIKAETNTTYNDFKSGVLMMCSAIQENTQETTNVLVYKVWMGKRGGTGVFADLV